SSLETGTQIRVSAGCDKQVSTCRAKFANELNFQGFPHMPGTDFVLSYPTRNTGENDGGVLVS
ncbi:MAG: phage BR0599 family protein, partial [Roseibium sp.]